MADKEGKAPIFVIKKIKKGGGHHGGAWKVAYADFVTAMMAFFLLLWLLNVTTKEQKAGIADYFNPVPKVSQSESGAGGLLGGLTMAPEGAMVTSVTPINNPPMPADPALSSGSEPGPPDQTTMDDTSVLEKARELEEQRFEDAQEALEREIAESSDLAEMAKNIMVDVTPEGLRIQIIDQENASMFAIGSAQMYEKTQKLLQKVTAVIRKLPNKVSVRGHTDSAPYAADAVYTNWELSADRANASRRVMLETSMPPDRIANVVGKADTDHLFPENPKDARNRRISIILLRDELTNPQKYNADRKGKGAAKSTEGAAPENDLYKKSKGSVEFP